MQSNKKHLTLNVSRQKIRRVLSSSENLKYSKMQPKLPLTKNLKQARFQYALENVTWTSEWDQVIFSDEKNLTWMVLMVITIIGII